MDVLRSHGREGVYRKPARTTSAPAARALVLAVVGVGTALYGAAARADLTDPTVLAQLNPLERLAAQANQAVYNALTTSAAGPNGAPTCAATQATAGGNCTGLVFNIFSRVRELVDNANALGNQANQPQQYSLGLDIHGLGQALRWTAAEEMSAQGATSTQFTNGQFSSLANRIAALRFGSRGFRVGMNNVGSGDALSAGLAPDGSSAAAGGAAGADGDLLSSPWGGFLDSAYGYGRKSDTTNSNGYEDAFAYDGADISGGVDYRFSPRFVLGVLLGYSTKRVDFDSTESTTDGRIRSHGGSLMAYGLWEQGDLFMSGSLGWQQLRHDFLRRITYPSLNPLVSSVNATATSNTNSHALLATYGLGYDFRSKAFTAEPYLKAEYQHLTIDGFTETGAGGFDFNYASQGIKSLDGAVGLKLQYVVTPRFGVIVPYVRGELHRQFEDKQRQVSAVYAALNSVGLASASNANFDIPTDQRKDTYGLVGAGVSLVFKHGIQAFAQYQQILGLSTIADRELTGGFRVEF